jgi:hypothetical protein
MPCAANMGCNDDCALHLACRHAAAQECGCNEGNYCVRDRPNQNQMKTFGLIRSATTSMRCTETN